MSACQAAAEAPVLLKCPSHLSLLSPSSSNSPHRAIMDLHFTRCRVSIQQHHCTAAAPAPPPLPSESGAIFRTLSPSPIPNSTHTHPPTPIPLAFTLSLIGKVEVMEGLVLFWPFQHMVVRSSSRILSGFGVCGAGRCGVRAHSSTPTLHPSLFPLHCPFEPQ